IMVREEGNGCHLCEAQISLKGFVLFDAMQQGTIPRGWTNSSCLQLAVSYQNAGMRFGMLHDFGRAFQIRQFDFAWLTLGYALHLCSVFHGVVFVLLNDVVKQGFEMLLRKDYFLSFQDDTVLFGGKHTKGFITIFRCD